GGDRNAEQREDRNERAQRIGRVGHHLAAAAERDLHVTPRAAGDEHEEERDREEDDEVHPGGDAAQVVPHLPGDDGAERAHERSGSALRCGAGPRSTHPRAWRAPARSHSTARATLEDVYFAALRRT